jgi:hypothetical protein
MSSPCGSCLSYPCACHGPIMKEGRYSYTPTTHDMQTSEVYCSYCYATPCVCSLVDDYHNSTADAYCIGCSCKPCICPAALSVPADCYCGICENCISWHDKPFDDVPEECDCKPGYECLVCGLPGTDEEKDRTVCFGCGHYNTKCICQELSDNWAHRSEGMKCGTCMWWVLKGDGKLGRCRKKAPTLNGWPAVFNMDWCGDHKMDETKI